MNRARAFDKIAAGLVEAIGIVRGDEAPARLHSTAELDVASIRTKTGLSQENFVDHAGELLRPLRKAQE